MHYYQNHIGDFRSGTVNMSRLMRWIYRDMLDVYYDTEKPMPPDLQMVCDLLGVDSQDETEVVKRILRFKFTLEADGYHNVRCDAEIAEYHAMAVKNQKNGQLGGRPKGSKNNPVGYQSEPSCNPNHEPITINHSKPLPEADASVFDEIWQAYPKRPGASKADALKAFRSRLKQGIKTEEMVTGVKRYAAYVKAQGTDPQFIKQPATFLGPGLHFLADWTTQVVQFPTAAPLKLVDHVAETKQMLKGYAGEPSRKPATVPKLSSLIKIEPK